MLKYKKAEYQQFNQSKEVRLWWTKVIVLFLASLGKCLFHKLSEETRLESNRTYQTQHNGQNKSHDYRYSRICP